MVRVHYPRMISQVVVVVAGCFNSMELNKVYQSIQAFVSGSSTNENVNDKAQWDPIAKLAEACMV